MKVAVAVVAVAVAAAEVAAAEQIRRVDARRSAMPVRGVLFLTKRACRPQPHHWPAPGCGRKA